MRNQQIKKFKSALEISPGAPCEKRYLKSEDDSACTRSKDTSKDIMTTLKLINKSMKTGCDQ